MGTYHGVHVLGTVDDTLHQHRLRTIILKELLHLRRQVLNAVTSNGVDVHRLRQRNEVRVVHTRVRVALIIEEVFTDVSKGPSRCDKN